jgi:hypothetical protein
VLVAVGAGLFSAMVPGHHPVVEKTSYDEANLAAAAASTPGDRVQEAIDGVQPTGFYVGPELRGQLTADEVTKIEEIIASAPVPLFVVWWADTADGGYNTPYAALDQLRVGVGRDGFYAVLTQGGYPILAGLGYDDPFVDADGKGRPAAALERYVTELAAVPRPEPETASGDEDWDYWGGPWGGIAAGLIFAALTYLGLLLVIGVSGVVWSHQRRGGRS